MYLYSSQGTINHSPHGILTYTHWHSKIWCYDIYYGEKLTIQIMCDFMVINKNYVWQNITAIIFLTGSSKLAYPSHPPHPPGASIFLMIIKGLLPLIVLQPTHFNHFL